MFPKRVEGLSAVGGQDFEQAANFFQNPQPFFGNSPVQLLECPAHATPDMELANLVSELKFLSQDLITG